MDFNATENIGDTNLEFLDRFKASEDLDFFLNRESDSDAYRFALPLPVRLANTILTKTSGDT